MIDSVSFREIDAPVYAEALGYHVAVDALKRRPAQHYGHGPVMVSVIRSVVPEIVNTAKSVDDGLRAIGVYVDSGLAHFIEEDTIGRSTK